MQQKKIWTLIIIRTFINNVSQNQHIRMIAALPTENTFKKYVKTRKQLF